MMKYRIWLAISLLTATLSAGAQGVSEPYSPGITQDAVSYWLPRTRLTVTVHACKTVYTPGEFSKYAERYLRMSGVSSSSNEKWEITGVEVSSCGVPDKDRLYTLAFPEKGERPYFQLTQDGILWAVNRHPKSDAPAPQAQSASDPKAKKVNPHDYLTEEILMAGSTSKMAELTAKEIYSIRESRNAITRGQADFIPTDGESLKFMLESLTEQENALMSMFTGSSETEESTYTITVDPEGPVTRQILFRFSTILGVLPVENLAGAPIWLDITSRNMLSQQPKAEPEKKSKKNASPFLYYRIPGQAGIRIYDNRNSFFEQDMQIAQLGNVEVVSSTIMGKRGDTQILFDPETGNISSINE